MSSLAGVLLVASFAPLSVYPAGWIAVALLVLHWRDSTNFDAWLSGFAFGATVMAVGGFWVCTSLINLGSYPAWLCIIAFLAYLVYQSLIISVVPLIARRFWPRRDWVGFLLLVPSLWALVEIARGWLALTWLSPGYGQIGGPLAGIAPYLGVQGVTLLNAVAGGLLAMAWQSRRAAWWKPASGLVVTLVATKLMAGVEFTQPQPTPIATSLVQGNMPSSTQWDFQVLDQTLEMYRQLSLQREAQAKPALVIWPETAAPIHYQRLSDFFNGLAKHSRESGVQYLVGTQSRIGTGPDALYYNIALHPSEPMQEYRKRQLVPFGEFLPPWLFTEAYRKAMKAEAVAMFSPGGDQQDPVTLAGQRVEIAICFESLFGEMLRRAPPDSGFLVMLTNDELFMGTPMPYQHLQIARMRAIETQRPVVRSANSGISAFIGADGEVQSRTPVRQRAFLDGSVVPRHGLTPYMRWGDAAVFALAVLMLALSRAFSGALRARAVR